MRPNWSMIGLYIVALFFIMCAALFPADWQRAGAALCLFVIALAIGSQIGQTDD